MDKKELKFYEAPACEVVELKLEGHLLAESDPVETPKGVSGDGFDDGFVDDED
jgi:hypothetical protein